MLFKDSLVLMHYLSKPEVVLVSQNNIEDNRIIMNKNLFL